MAVAPDAQAVDSVIGRPRVPKPVGQPAGDRAELGRLERSCVFWPRATASSRW